MMDLAISPAMRPAEGIPYLNADEAHVLMVTAFDRFMRLIESLSPEDWSLPTACTEWNVRDMVAHQAGGYASGTSYREFMRQVTHGIPRPGQLIEDAVNAFQLKEREEKSPQELIAELHTAGPLAIRKWAHGFRLLRSLPFPHPIAGTRPLHYLFWVIHSRDTWMHRLDICRATDRPFEQTREHDGRINELVVRDVAGKLNKKLDGHAITLSLTGIAGGTWKIGTGDIAAGIEMDALDFNIFVSGRYSYEQGLNRAEISGERSLIEHALKDVLILY